jgi:hypothetical protein
VKKLLKLSVLVGVFSLASLLSPGVVAPLQAACSGYNDCAFLAGKSCTNGTPCCYQGDQGYCNCANSHYFCAI